MITVQTYFFLLLFQVTAISVVALAMIFVVRRSAAMRHTIALTGIALVLMSPLVTWLLPLRWHALMTVSSPSGSNSFFIPSAAATVADVETTTDQERLPAFDGSARHDARLEPSSSAMSMLSDQWLDRSDTNTAAVTSTEPTPQENAGASLPSDKTQLARTNTDQRSDKLATETRDRFRDSSLGSWTLFGLTCFLGVWFGGAIIRAIRLLSRRRQFYVEVKPLRQLPTGALSASMQHRLRTTLGVRELPPIWTSQSIPSPVVWGVLRPVVVLPETLLRELSEQALTSVLIHEGAHIVRRDHWNHVWQQIAGIVWWFHPGVLMLNQVLARSREEVCDNYVLRHSSPADSARTLLELTERGGSVRPALSLLGLFGRRWSLETRVTELLNPGRNMMLKTELRWTTLFVAVMAACCVIVGGVSAVQVDKPVSPLAEPTAAKSSVDQVNVEDEPPFASEPTPLTQDDASGLTLRGQCRLLGTDKPIQANVRAFLLGNSHYAVPKLLGELRSDESGQFALRELDLKDVVPGDDRFHRILVIATSPGYSSAMAWPKVGLSDRVVDDMILELSDNLATLSGTITDANGNPVKGASVFLNYGSGHAIAGFHSAITDFSGRYEINDLQPWNPEDTATFDKKTGTGTRVSAFYFSIQHPDFANSRAKYTELPQVVNIKLQRPAIIEGQVVDLVTGTSVPNVTVQAQGITRSDFYQVLTDTDGRYTLRVNRDHYNIWALVADRMPLAIKALEAESGVRTSGRDIHMVRGGFVTGRVLSPAGEPLPFNNDHVHRVAHHGPARPRTGAAVSGTTVNADGTFRLHVAPGRNYIYSQTQPAAASVEVGDGQEVELDLIVVAEGQRPFREIDEDYLLAGRLLRAAMLEDQEAEAAAQADRRSSETGKDQNEAKPESGGDNSANQSRIRRDSPTSRLLNKLEKMNGSLTVYNESWAESLRAIVKLGSDAVPELIEELDATNDSCMLRCLGFILRAIGDKRAIPALIRSIPKTLQPPSSDLGRSIENNEALLQFMQQHDLDEPDTGNSYGVGRPIREVFGALQVLSGQKFNEEELYTISRSGFPSQIHAQKRLFNQIASQWREWWEEVGSLEVDDPTYKKVHLAPFAEQESLVVPEDGLLKSDGGTSGAILESIRKSQLRSRQFFDLDTGRSASLPKQWNPESLSADDVSAILRWASAEGFDIVGDEYKDADGKATFAIRTIGLLAWQLDDTRWKSLPAEFTVAKLKTESQPVPEDWLLHRDPESAAVDPQRQAAFLYVTREGTPGVIYVGIPVVDDSLQPGGYIAGDLELDPVAFRKGRRYGLASFLPHEASP